MNIFTLSSALRFREWPSKAGEKQLHGEGNAHCVWSPHHGLSLPWKLTWKESLNLPLVLAARAEFNFHFYKHKIKTLSKWSIFLEFILLFYICECDQ